MLIPDEVHIWREPDGDYHVEWQASRPDTQVTVEALATGVEVASGARDGDHVVHLLGVEEALNVHHRRNDGVGGF